MRRAAAAAAAALALAVGAAGCGSGSDSGDKETTAKPAATAPATATATASPQAGGGAGLEDLNAKPSIPKPTGRPPKRLKIHDIVKGTGPRARAGDAVTVQYVGVSYSTGREFDASWDHGQPFTFQLGAGQVIPGWDKGVAGMRVGGRRELTIPPGLAYGAQGSPPAIAPGETLVFVVDLKRIG